MIRKIIQINEAKCNGCGLCIPNCPEGALQIIDGKARLVSDLFCDGLGACIGHCPEDAIRVVEREAEPYDETKVMDIIAPQGRNTILAHLDHLRSHHETGYLNEAINYIKNHQIDMSPGASGNVAAPQLPGAFSGITEARQSMKPASPGGCAGCRQIDLKNNGEEKAVTPVMAGNTPFGIPSQLKQWPVQMHLINPGAAAFKGADVLLAADCVAYAMGDFHNRMLNGKALAIACPKLDTDKEIYVEKLTAMISQSGIKSLTVAMMEVPCCGGLLRMVAEAIRTSGISLPVRRVVVSIKGEILEESLI